MGVVKSHPQWDSNGPSTFALLVDDINKMSEAEQKLLWLQINKDKVSSLAKEIDNATNQHNFSSEEIDALIIEARKNGSKKKS